MTKYLMNEEEIKTASEFEVTDMETENVSATFFAAFYWNG